MNGALWTLSTLWTDITRAFRRTALPLAAYYAITLALPLANGAARSGAAFAYHALVVLVIPPAITLLASVLHTVQRRCRTRIGSKPSVDRIVRARTLHTPTIARP